MFANFLSSTTHRWNARHGIVDECGNVVLKQVEVLGNHVSCGTILLVPKAISPVNDNSKHFTILLELVVRLHDFG